ncbi:MAG: DUF1566 domain-containing protein [Spirochaetes bacterium]|jgi:formylglycine-generating enzyme required for sulfatase activity|nr:DUF1566 domain-containing protein [Spirochaetota bacterium]
MKTLQNRILQLALFAILIAGTAVLYAVGSGKQLPVTGQTTVHTANDDGTYQTGTDAPSVRFSDNGNGTITDNMTGLMWLQSPDSTKRGWRGAITYCEGLDYASHSDWRLPTVNELETLANYSQSALSTWLNGQGFTNVQANYYWSSTTYAPSTPHAWYIDMNDGILKGDFNKTQTHYVWPVRSAAP